MKVGNRGWLSAPDAHLSPNGALLRLHPQEWDTLGAVGKVESVCAKDHQYATGDTARYAKPLAAPMSRVLAAFRAISEAPESDQGEALVAFTQKYGAMPLCWHGGRRTEAECIAFCPPMHRDGWTVLRVADAVRWSTALDAAVLGFEATHAGARLLEWQPKALRAVLADHLGFFAEAAERALSGREFNREAQKRLLSSWVRGVGHSAPTYLSMEWAPKRRPEVVLVGDGLLAALILQVTMTAGVDTDATHLCSVCGMPYTPARGLKPGEGLYCQWEGCQRERRRRNKQAQRQAKAAKS